MGGPGKAPVSVLIPAGNEERNIAKCIKSVSWADEVVVLDSFSSDKTAQIARDMGAKVFQREFEDYASHFNWGLDNIDFEYEWILIVHADERVTEGLAAEIGALLRRPLEPVGYYIARQHHFAGKWIRYGGWYPSWTLRLLRKGYGRYESRMVNEHVVLDGPAGFLENPMVHYDYRGIERYFDRHNTYSSMEAVEAYRVLSRRSENKKLLPARLTARGPERWRLLKNLAYRYLPARALIRFLWMYLLRLGFLDGRIGFRFCFLQAFYEYQISLKLEELRDPESPMYQKYKEQL